MAFGTIFGGLFFFLCIIGVATMAAKAKKAKRKVKG